jgi:hypothetical protein
MRLPSSVMALSSTIGSDLLGMNVGLTLSGFISSDCNRRAIWSIAEHKKVGRAKPYVDNVQQNTEEGKRARTGERRKAFMEHGRPNHLSIP